jgi:hypothetical protein
LGKDDLCPRPEKSTAKCPFGSLLFEDKACQKVPPGAVIDTENEPIYDSLTDGHRITKYNECEASTFANKDECTPCEPGTFSTAMSTECSVCKPGSIVNSTKTECEECPAGEFMEGIECVSCPDGQVSTAGSTSCRSCVAGERPSANQDACEKCTNNTYNTDGLICKYCEGGVNDNATECKICDTTYEKVVPGRGCERCPSGQRVTTHPNQRNCVPDCDLMIWRNGERYHIQPREFGYNKVIDLANIVYAGFTQNLVSPMKTSGDRLNLTNRNECAIDRLNADLNCQINTNIIDGQEWGPGDEGDHSIGWYTKSLSKFKFTNKIDGHECNTGDNKDGKGVTNGGMVKDKKKSGNGRARG